MACKIYQALKEEGKEHGHEVSDLVKLCHIVQYHYIKKHTKAILLVCVKTLLRFINITKIRVGKWIALNEGVLLGAPESLVELKINYSDPLIS